MVYKKINSFLSNLCLTDCFVFSFYLRDIKNLNLLFRYQPRLLCINPEGGTAYCVKTSTKTCPFNIQNFFFFFGKKSKISLEFVFIFFFLFLLKT